MSRSTDVGHLVVLDLEDEVALCVDDSRIIRGVYRTAYRDYFSPYELWSNERGYGRLVGNIAVGHRVTAIGNGDCALCYDGTELRDVPIFATFTVRISEMLAHPSVIAIEALLADCTDA